MRSMQDIEAELGPLQPAEERQAKRIDALKYLIEDGKLHEELDHRGDGLEAILEEWENATGNEPGDPLRERLEEMLRIRELGFGAEDTHEIELLIELLDHREAIERLQAFDTASVNELVALAGRVKRLEGRS